MQCCSESPSRDGSVRDGSVRDGSVECIYTDVVDHAFIVSA